MALIRIALILRLSSLVELCLIFVTQEIPAPDVVETFKRGIKRDATVYPIFQDERTFDNFHTTTIAMARSHDVENVFDPTFKPTTDIDKALFAKSRSLYMLF